MKNRQSIFAYTLLAVFLLGGIAYMLAPFLTDSTPSVREVNVPETTTSEPIIKEGEVVFLRDGKKIVKIDVEIAENDAERNKGLMYRPYIPDSAGMLFIFPEPKELGFWMKNTQIPLDIIYVDAYKKLFLFINTRNLFPKKASPPMALRSMWWR
jgi:uncharacterized membrane protein (UPF0127 family)